MSRTVKIWLIAAAFLMVLGLIIFAGAMHIYDWNFDGVGTMKYETKTYEASGDFDKISIGVHTTKIEFVPSDDEKCRIVCFESEKVKHSVTVQNETLVIDTVDTRKWYDYIGIFLGEPKMTVYMPHNEYASLFIDTSTGDIVIPNGFAFEDVNIKGSTADVKFFAEVSNAMEIKLSTGDIKVSGLSPSRLSLTTTTGKIDVNFAESVGTVGIKTSTGAIELSNVNCTDFSAESSTGTVYLRNVVAAIGIFVKSNSGDVRFENSDAAQITVKTSTGDVNGTLLSEKIFITKTSTGRVNVPATAMGGRCEVTTSTGNIRIYVIIDDSNKGI